MKTQTLLLCGLVLFWPKFISRAQKSQLIFWNVGQGAWTTLMNETNCLHIDSGGTQMPALKSCTHKANILYFTHYDWDHVNFVKKLAQRYRHLCLAEQPPPNLSRSKKKIFSLVPLCSDWDSRPVRRIYTSSFQRKNESHAYILSNRFLITGDSDQKIEHVWLRQASLKGVETLLAGHHGSRTSTSASLLESLKSLTSVVYSCEKSRYGHPHSETQVRLKKRNILGWSTEHYGSVAFEIN